MTIEFGGGANQEAATQVPSLVLEVDSSSIRDYLKLSDQLPILLVFVAGEDLVSEKLIKSITSVVEKAAGAILALVVDATKSPEIAQAFELSSVPSAFGLLKGQPAPLFVGDQPIEQIQLVVNRVLEVARENSLTGKVQVVAQVSEPELSPTLQAAYAAIDSGKYSEALALYEKALVEKPNDDLAEAGMAQVKLLIRLEGKDLAELSNGSYVSQEDLFLKSDALIATGQAKAGFEILLGLFEKTAKDQREAIRVRLVELFLVVGKEHPDVIEARRLLSLLLF